MKQVTTKPFQQNTSLTGYMPLPRAVLKMTLSSTATLLYAVLLDRGTLSQKNSYVDDAGQVYVIYPTEKLAEAMGKSVSTMKSCLTELSQAGLIDVRRPVKNRPNHIYLNLPADSIQTGEGAENEPGSGQKIGCSGGRKPPPNNKRKQPDRNDYYQYREDESL